jgi:hypothetical protein
MESKALIKALKESGLPFIVLKVKLTPEQRKREKQIERDVKKYVMAIEEAHKKAVHSTLRFKEEIRGTKLSSVPLLIYKTDSNIVFQKRYFLLI